MVPRGAHLGAALFLPVMTNIFVVTVALGFRGTPWITGSMLLAVVFLCAWDYDRFRGMLTERPWSAGAVPRLRLDAWERVGFVFFAASLLAVFGSTRSIATSGMARVALLTGAAAGLFTLLRFAWVGRRLRA